MTVVGVVGGGQLARMMALAGLPLGIRLRVLDPTPDAPAAAVAEHLCADYDDPTALDRLARGAAVVTYEIEHLPIGAIAELSRRVPVRPNLRALEVTSDRMQEKRFVERLGGTVAPWAPVDDLPSLVRAVATLGTPAILKTRRQGYDGRGQAAIDRPEGAAAAWEAIGRRPAILERRVAFDRELSLVAVRAQGGETRCYPLTETRHRDGILRSALAPAPGVSDALRHEAEKLASTVLEDLGYVGVLTIELFERDGRLRVNELAPRVHNSGHWTIEGAATSQFENHLRALLGLRLGGTEARGPSALVNLLGALPEPRDVLRVPDAHLHLYGKAPRPGRKLGHVTVRAATWSTLIDRVRAVESLAAAATRGGDRPATARGSAHSRPGAVPHSLVAPSPAP